jgi:hypothetical protein
MSDTIQSSDLGLQQTVESLIQARPDLMDPTRLRLFERLLNNYVESHQSGPAQTVGRLTTPPGRFMAFVLNLCGAYFAVMPVILIFPTVPLPVLPCLAVIGFMVSRHLAPRIDERAERTARERATRG